MGGAMELILTGTHRSKSLMRSKKPGIGQKGILDL